MPNRTAAPSGRTHHRRPHCSRTDYTRGERMELTGWQWPIGLLAFVGELTLVAGLGVAAYRLGGAGVLGAAAAAVSVIVLGTLWGRFLSPRATRRLPRPGRAAVVALLGALIAGMLASTGDMGGWAVAVAALGIVLAATQLVLPEPAGVAGQTPGPA